MGEAMKGQAETIIVLGIIVIAAVAVVFVTQREMIFPPSTEVAALRNALANEVEQDLYSAAQDAISTVAMQGGFLSPPELSVSYQGSDVPYWQYGGQALIPDKAFVSIQIGNSVKQYMNSVAMTTYQGKDVAKGAASSADVTITPDSVTLKVWMPVTLEGYALRQPFTVTVPSSLGRAHDVASQIVDKNLEGRHIEYFTVASIAMYRALDEMAMPKVPFFGILTECGQMMFKTWFDVKDEMDLLVRGSLRRIYMAGQTPDNILENSNFPVNVFPLKTEVPVTFTLGEPLDSRNFQFNPNPVRAQAELVPFTPFCMSPPYQVNYWLLYPVIAEVDAGGSVLRFAVQVYVDENKPGDWAQASIQLSEWMEQIELCEFTRCTANLTVLDRDGPVRDAQVVFTGCGLGRTADDGTIQADIPCAMGLLEIYKDQNHEVYKEFAGPEALENRLIYISRNPLLTLNIFNMQFVNDSGTARVIGITRNDGRNATIMATTEGGVAALVSDKGVEVTQILPVGLVDVGAYITEGTTFLGGFLMTYIFTEDDQDLYIYIPTLSGGIQDMDSVYALQEVLESCGVLAITEQPLNETEVISSCGGPI